MRHLSAAMGTLPSSALHVCAGFPSSFLAMRPLQWLLRPMLDATRPMDGMAMSFQLPAEDEIATSGLSGEGSAHGRSLGLRSPWLRLVGNAGSRRRVQAWDGV